MKNYVLFIDSGIGGLTTLASSLKKTRFNAIYFADNKFAPYGNLSQTFIQNRLKTIIQHLIDKYNINLIVLACNTATTSSIDFLRKNFPTLTFIGTEPAFKVAFDEGFANPLIVATYQTIKQLKEKQQLKNIKFLPMKNLAKKIDEFHLNSTPFYRYKILKDLIIIKQKSRFNDSIILGCTHFCFIKKLLKQQINLPIFDGNDGVSRRLASFCTTVCKKNAVKIILSDNNSRTKQKYIKILRQILANPNYL